LMISFVPEYGNIILHKYFSSKKYEKFATIYNGRSYFYRNNVSIFNESFDQIYKEDQNFSFLKKSVVLSIYHLDKQIILTPIFIFRSIFLGGNTEMIKDLFPEKNNFYLFLPLFTKIINPLFGLIFFISFFIINKKTFNINHKITLLFIFYVVLAYASFSHFLPRYSVIYLPSVYIFVFNFLISLKPR